MNGFLPSTNNFIGALGEYPVYEYLANNYISSNALTSQNYISSNSVDLMTNNYISSNAFDKIMGNLIYGNNNNTIVKGQNEIQFKANEITDKSKIANDGTLQVYHNFDPILFGTFAFPAGWWNIHDKIAGAYHQIITLQTTIIETATTAGGEAGAASGTISGGEAGTAAGLISGGEAGNISGALAGANAANQVMANYLPLSGGTLTGNLSAPIINASTKLQEGGTDLTNKYLQLSGGTMIGNLTAPIINASTNLQEAGTDLSNKYVLLNGGNITYTKPLNYANNTLSIDYITQTNLSYVFKQGGTIVNPVVYSGNTYEYTFTASGTVNFNANTTLTKINKNASGNVVSTDIINYTTPNQDYAITISNIYTYYISTFTISPNTGTYQQTPILTFQAGNPSASGVVILNYTSIAYIYPYNNGVYDCYWSTKPTNIYLSGGGDGTLAPTQASFTTNWTTTTINGTTVYYISSFVMISNGANYVRTDTIIMNFTGGVVYSGTQGYAIQLTPKTINTIVLSNAGVYNTNSITIGITPPLTGTTTITANMTQFSNNITSITVRFLNANSQTYKAIYDNPINPSFTWRDNSSTGIYQPTTNQIGFAINGSAVCSINSAGFKGDGSQLTNINYNNLLNLPTIPSITNLYPKSGGTIYGNVVIETGYTISGNGSGLTNIPYSSLTGTPTIPTLPTYNDPLSVSNGVVSLGIVPVAKGGTNCANLASYFVKDVNTNTLTISQLPYANLSGVPTIPTLPTYQTPLSVSNGLVSLSGIVSVANGGTNCANLASYFVKDVNTNTLTISQLPYANLSGTPTIPTLPTYNDPLSVSNGIVSLTGTVSTSKGGTGCTSLATYFVSSGNTLTIANLPYSQITDKPYVPTFTTDPFTTVQGALSLKYDSSTLGIDATTGKLKVISSGATDWSAITNKPSITVVNGGSTSLPSITENSVANKTWTFISGNDYYYKFTSTTGTNTITFTSTTSVEVFAVGGGGNGGTGAYSGGGGAGEIVSISSYSFSAGTYNITVGTAENSSTIKDNTNTITYFNALKGGTGGTNNTITSTITTTTTTTPSYAYGIYINNSTTSSGTLTAGTSATITFGSGTISVVQGGTTIVNNDNSYPIISTPSIWYKFDTSTNLGVDSSGSYNMTNNGSITESTGLKGTGCLNLNGSSQYLSLNTGLSLNNTSFTIAFWVYRTRKDIYEWIYNLGSIDSLHCKLMIMYRADNTIAFAFYDDDLNSTTTNTEVNEWVHWTFVFEYNGSSSGTQKIYKNGALNASRTSTGKLSTNNYTKIGCDHSLSYKLSGKLDDFRIYNSALTATQISELYTGRVDLIYNQIATTGGSGGGGYGGVAYQANTTNWTISNIPVGATHTVASGFAGTLTQGGAGGGSGVLYLSNTYGVGGSGASSTSTPIVKTANSGSGGDGNGGYGASGTIIFKITSTGTTSSSFYYGQIDTSSSPSFSFTGDTTTGMFHPNLNQIGFSIAGTQKLLINSTGISGDGSQLTNIAYSSLTIADNTIPYSKLLINAGDIPYSKLTIADGAIPYVKLLINDNIIPYSKLLINAGDIPYSKLTIADGAIPYVKLTIADGAIPYSKLSGTPTIPTLPSYTQPLSVSNGTVSVGYDNNTIKMNANNQLYVYQSSSQWTTTGISIYYINNVGIGTNSFNSAYSLTIGNNGMYSTGNINITGLTAGISGTLDYFASTTINLVQQTAIIINTVSLAPTLSIGSATITFALGGITIIQGGTTIVSDNSYPIISTPSAWYKFDTSTNLGIDVYNTYNMTNNGSITIASGIKGTGCLNLNGSTQYLSLDAGLTLNNTSFTIAFWMYRTRTGVYEWIYNLGSVDANGQKLMIMMRSGNTFAFAFYNDDLDSTSTTEINQWIHWSFVFEYNGSTAGTQKIYKNGTLNASRTTTGKLSTNNYTKIGCDNSLGYKFTGKLDDFRIYNSALTATQISELYTGRLTIPKTVINHIGINDTVSTPSFTWNNNTNTGIYSPTTNQVGISCAGTNVATFSSGNLTVNGSITASSFGSVNCSSVSSSGAITGTSLNVGSGSISAGTIYGGSIFGYIRSYQGQATSAGLLAGAIYGDGFAIPTNGFWQDNLAGGNYCMLNVSLKWTDASGIYNCYWGGRFYLGRPDNLSNTPVQIRWISNDINLSYNNYAFASFDTANPNSSSNGAYDGSGSHYIRAKVNSNNANTNGGNLYYKIIG